MNYVKSGISESQKGIKEPLEASMFIMAPGKKMQLTGQPIVIWPRLYNLICRVAILSFQGRNLVKPNAVHAGKKGLI